MDPEDVDNKMTQLARTFPCLRNASGVSPWEPTQLDCWAAGPVSHGERITASFLLGVWDRSVDWQSGRIDLMEALDVWSPSHRSAFLAWAADPWWP